MKKIKMNNFDTSLYFLEGDNKFRSYMVPLENKSNYQVILGVKYGGRDINFSCDEKVYTMPTGIAHFLEHKMFEKDDNPFSFYQRSGTDVNASTCHDYTIYYIEGNKNFENNLKYLMNWVSSLSLTEELVEKEKGIILEEANMYKDNPRRVLMQKSLENILEVDPYRYKVIGSDNDIKRIRLDDVMTCFKTFYSSDNMFLIVVGNFDKDACSDIILSNCSLFTNSKRDVVRNYGYESDNIPVKYEDIYMNVECPKICCSYKVSKDMLDKLSLSSFERDLYIGMLIDIGLGHTAAIREVWLKDKLIDDTSYFITELDSHYIISFSASSNKPDEIEAKLYNYLQDIEIDEASFERCKKLGIAHESTSMSHIYRIANNILDDIINYNDYIPNKIDIIRNMDYNTMLKIKEFVKFDNKSIVKILPIK